MFGIEFIISPYTTWRTLYVGIWYSKTYIDINILDGRMSPYMV